MEPSAETLMNQAGYTAEHWMKQAIESIDQQFGEGYARSHPELVSGFMIAASNDQLAMYQGKRVEKLNDVGNCIDNLANEITLMRLR